MLQNFRRKKYVRQRLHPLASDAMQELAIIPLYQALTSASPRTKNQQATPVEEPFAVINDDTDVDMVQNVHALLCSDDTIDEWIRHYESERQQFSSFAVFVEMKLDKLQEQYVTLVGRPNAVEAAACCATLIQMPGIVGCYASLLKKLAAGLQSAIYEPDRDPNPAAISSDGAPMSVLVRQCYGRKPYFQRVRELERQMHLNRNLASSAVLHSLTIDEIVRIFRHIPHPRLQQGLVRAFSKNYVGFEQLITYLQNQHQQSIPTTENVMEDDPQYPFQVPLTSSAQICRAIAHHAHQFSSSGKDMILCSILEFVDVDSFKDVFKRFDSHGKTCFLHHLSVMESPEHLQTIMEDLPNAGETLFRFYLVTCGAQGDPKNPTKRVFFQRLLSAEMEYFFLCDLAAYINDEQWALLAKEFEKNALERKNRRRSARSRDQQMLDDDDYDDDDDVNDTDPAAQNGGSARGPSPLETFQVMIWNFLRHHHLSGTQIIALIQTVLMPSLIDNEYGLLAESCFEKIKRLGRWNKVLDLVDTIDRMADVCDTTSTDEDIKSDDGDAIAHVRIKTLKKIFTMLSRDERIQWVKKLIAAHPELIKQPIAKPATTTFVTAAPDIQPNRPTAHASLDDLKALVVTMRMDEKMKWIEVLLDALARDRESSARTIMLKQVLQPFLNGEMPSTTPNAPTLQSAEQTIQKLLTSFSEADRAKLLLKFAPQIPPTVISQPVETRPRTSTERSTSPLIPHVDQLPQLPSWASNTDLVNSLQNLLVIKTEEQVVELLNRAATMDTSKAPESHEGSTHHSLQVATLRKLSAVTAIAEPMEWQEYVKLGHIDVGCQTGSDLDQAQQQSLKMSTELQQDTASTIAPPTKLTLSTLLGAKTGNVVAGGKKKDAKYQKINSAAVPKSIAGLITSWRMNTDQLVQFAKKSLSNVLKTIADAYGEMLTAGRRKILQNPGGGNSSSRGSNSRDLSLAQIVYQSFLHSYGLPGIADMHLLAFSCALETYRLQHLRVEYFARYCFEEAPASELINYMEFLESIVCDDIPVPNNATAKPGQPAANTVITSKRLRYVPRITVPDKENWMIALDKAQENAQLCFRAMRKQDVAAFCDRLATIASQGTSSAIITVDTNGAGAQTPPNGSTVSSDPTQQLNVDHLLQLVMQEWRDEQIRRETHLLNAFRAGDVNGDGQLTSAEFAHIVLSIDHTRELEEILLMYSETLRRTECDQINTDVFLQVAKENELDRVVWMEEGDLRNISNGFFELDMTWDHVRGFFLGTLEALARDLTTNHFLRVCEGAGCGCLKCILDGYLGFQRMRREAQLSTSDPLGGMSMIAVSDTLVWARFWHLMRQLNDAAAESPGILTPWEGCNFFMRVEPAPPMAPRYATYRRNALPSILFPDTNRITGRMSSVHDPEVFEAEAILAQFSGLLELMTFKEPPTTSMLE